MMLLVIEMKNKILKLIGVGAILATLTGCGSSASNISVSRNDTASFKYDYESLNGTTNSSGKEFRSITVDENSHITIATLDQINQYMDDGKTFMVYFGFSACPWCRSMLPYFLKNANEMGVDNIYYVNVRSDNTENTDIRDIYSLDENKKVYLSHSGSDAYHTFIKRASSVLEDYSHGDIKSLDGTEFEGAKRLGAPNIIIVNKGNATDMITGISDLQNDGYQELTDDIVNDMNKIDKEFINKYLSILGN